MSSTPVMAQPSGAPAAGIQLGPLGLTPSITFSDVGVDTNVNGSADEPVRDFMGRVAPSLGYALRVRRVHVSGTSTVAYVYFNKSVERRSVDVIHTGRVELRTDIASPRVTGTYGYTSSRPNAEIDTWVRQLNRNFAVGVDLHVGGPRVTVGLDVGQDRPDYSGQSFEGNDLQTQLNRTSQFARASVSVALTPLTTFIVTGDDTRDRFEFSPIRDTESVGGTIGVSLKPAALISGTASVGYRQAHALDPQVPDFSGVVANVGVSYLLKGRANLALDVHRSREYSADPNRPYYVATGGRFTVTLPIRGAWDVSTGIGRDELAYSEYITPDAPQQETRFDYVDTAIGGIGRRLGEGKRIGLNVNYVSRRSPVRSRTYDQWRIGLNFTYGV